MISAISSPWFTSISISSVKPGMVCPELKGPETSVFGNRSKQDFFNEDLSHRQLRNRTVDDLYDRPCQIDHLRHGFCIRCLSLTAFEYSQKRCYAITCTICVSQSGQLISCQSVHEALIHPTRILSLLSEIQLRHQRHVY